MRKSWLLVVLAVAAVPLFATGMARTAVSSSDIIINFKMTMNARFERAIEDPEIREVRLGGTLQCKANARTPSTLTIKIGRIHQFLGSPTRSVACKPLNPNASRVGGSWSGEVVGKCNRKPAVARLFVSDDTRGGGDIRLTVKAPGAGAACNFAVAKKNLLGSLTARMGRA